MNSFSFLSAHKDCRKFAESLSGLIAIDSERLTKLSSVSKITTQNKKEIQKLKQEIEYNQKILEDVRKMETLKVGSWVRNGSSKPGIIKDLRLVGKIPEVQVLWWNDTATIPESPRHLKLLEPSDTEYGWKDGKLLRNIDSYECEDPQILNSFLLETLDPIRTAYLKERISLFSSEEIKLVSIDQIRRDGGTQQRIKLNDLVVAQYCEAMKGGDKFPPVSLTFDGVDYWLTDGFHTTQAALLIGKSEIEARVTQGTHREAILASVGVNSAHGLQRSNADKRQAVMTMLEDSEWQNWSNRKIAKYCRVTEGLVRKIKLELEDKKELVPVYGCVQYALDQKIDQESGRSSALSNANKFASTDESIEQTSAQCDGRSINNNLINYFIGQIVEISGSQNDKRLKKHHRSLARVAFVYHHSVNLEIWGETISNVSKNDIRAIKTDSVVRSAQIKVSLFEKMLSKFDSFEAFLDHIEQSGII